MNVLDMTISRVSRISMALSLMLLASWVWFNFLTQPQATNLFVKSPSMFQKISIGNLTLPGNNVLQAREGSATIADLPPLLGSQSQVRQLDSVEILENTPLGNSGLGNTGLGTGQTAVTNFSDAAIQGGPAPLLPSAQRQNIMISELPFLVNAPPADDLGEGEQIVIAAPSGRLTVNPFAPIYVEEEQEIVRTPVVNSAPSNSASNTANQRQPRTTAAEVVEEPLKPKIAIGTVPTPRTIVPAPARQSNLPASLSTASLAAKPNLLRAPIRSSYYNVADVPEPVVIEVPAEVVETEVVAEPVKLDRSRLTGIRTPIGNGQSGQNQASISTRSYTGNNAASNNSEAGALPSVTQAPASPTIATRLPQTAGVRPALTVPTLQPIGLAQAQLIGRRNVPVVEAPIVEEVVEEVVEAPVPQLRPVQIALRIPEPDPPAPVAVVEAPVVAPIVQEVVEVPVVEEVVEEPIVEEVIEEPVVEEVDVIEIPASQPYIATVSNTLDIAQPATVDTSTMQATAAPATSEQAEASDVAGVSLVANYVRDNNISFTGAILGPVSVAIFESRMGSFHVPIGEMIPDTEIRLTNVKRHEVELRQGSESHIIYLDLGQ